LKTKNDDRQNQAQNVSAWPASLFQRIEKLIVIAAPERIFQNVL
jgi:hypothetical protein